MGRLLFTNGTNIKNIDLPQYPDAAWEFTSEAPPDADNDLYSRVAAVFRAANLTADATAGIPFALVDAQGEDYDVSDDWQNKVNFMPNPFELIRLWRLSLTMSNMAYGFMEGNRVIKKLRYIVPATIKPIVDPVNGLTGFTRTLGTVSNDYTLKDRRIFYIWRLDHTTELLPSKNTEFLAMCNAAGVLYYADYFIKAFFKRGGIRPTMLMVKGVPTKQARDEIETIWDKVIHGWYKYLGKVFNADAIEPKVIGDGIDALKDQNLADGRIADIAMAIGMPLSLLLSNSANYATAQTEMVQWYRNSLVPWCNFMAECMNEQLFTPLNLHFEFRPEMTDPGQEDEVSRAGAYASYVSAGMKPSIAAQVVGIELPNGVEYEDLDPDEQPEETKPTTDNAEVVEEPTDAAAEEQPASKGWVTINGAHVLLGDVESDSGNPPVGKTEHNQEFNDALRKKVSNAENSKDWSKLPTGFEIDRVRNIAKEIVPHVKDTIRGRIKIQKATTFLELKEGVEIAIAEMEAKLSKYTAKFLPSIDQLREMELWQSFAFRKLKRGETLDFDFTAKTLPADVADNIRERLAGASDEAEVKAVFEYPEVKGWVTINGAHVLLGDVEPVDAENMGSVIASDFEPDVSDIMNSFEKGRNAVMQKVNLDSWLDTNKQAIELYHAVTGSKFGTIDLRTGIAIAEKTDYQTRIDTAYQTFRNTARITKIDNEIIISRDYPGRNQERITALTKLRNIYTAQQQLNKSIELPDPSPAILELAAALNRAVDEVKYSPDQPRDDQGQWTSIDGIGYINHKDYENKYFETHEPLAVGRYTGYDMRARLSALFPKVPKDIWGMADELNIVNERAARTQGGTITVSKDMQGSIVHEYGHLWQSQIGFSSPQIYTRLFDALRSSVPLNDLMKEAPDAVFSEGIPTAFQRYFMDIPLPPKVEGVFDELFK